MKKVVDHTSENLIEKMSEFVEKKLAPPLVKISENRYLDSIQKGFILFTPFIIAGSIFLLLASLPIPGWTNFILPVAGKLWGAVNSIYGIMSIAISTSIAYFLCERYKINSITGAVISLMSFLMMFPLASDEDGSLVMPASDLGGTGLFTAIIVAIVTVEIYHFFIAKKITIKLPEGVPPMVSEAFIALIPTMVILTFWWAIRQLFEINLPVVIMSAFAPLVTVGDSLPAVTGLFTLDRLLWFVGIHGSNVIQAVAEPIWMTMKTENALAAQLGNAIPFIGTEEFLNAFPRISVLPICIALLLSKDKGLKDLGGLGLPGSIFNICEPILYGLPIVLNPLMFIPWVFGYLLIAAMDYLVVLAGLVSIPYIVVPWTTPGPLMAYLSTGGDWRAIVLSIINYVIVFAIFYPFIKVYEKVRLKEQEGEIKDGIKNQTN